MAAEEVELQRREEEREYRLEDISQMLEELAEDGIDFEQMVLIPRELEDDMGEMQEEPTPEHVIAALPQRPVETTCECAICQECLPVNSIATHLKCGHAYHEACIRPWLQKQHTCPICRTDVLAGNERASAENEENEAMRRELLAAQEREFEEALAMDRARELAATATEAVATTEAAATTPRMVNTDSSTGSMMEASASMEDAAATTTLSAEASPADEPLGAAASPADEPLSAEASPADEPADEPSEAESYEQRMQRLKNEFKAEREAAKAQEEAAKAQQEAAKAQEEAAKAQEQAAKAQADRLEALRALARLRATFTQGTYLTAWRSLAPSQPASKTTEADKLKAAKAIQALLRGHATRRSTTEGKATGQADLKAQIKALHAEYVSKGMSSNQAAVVAIQEVKARHAASSQ